MQEPSEKEKKSPHIFSGHIYIFHAFDVGDEINLNKVKESGQVLTRPLKLSKYFKNYHIPLAIDLPHPNTSSNCISVNIHNFGAISLVYKIPFNDTLENVRKSINAIDNQYQEQSIGDVSSIFKKIRRYITKPKFFHTRSWYPVIQVEPDPAIEVTKLIDQYGGIIASTLRFEIETLSEYQKNEILESAIGYFKGDLIVIDTEAAFVYDKEHEETLDFFEFANIQHLELRYFDRLLNQQLNIIYEEEIGKLPFKAYLPFIGTHAKSPIGDLGKLRVDISVITERLEGSIKLAGEAYFSELYELLVDKLDLKSWRASINKKLDIVQDIRTVYQHKIDAIREDMLTMLIILLIFIELVIGILK